MADSTKKLFRRALCAELTRVTEIPFVGGPLTSASEGDDIGCVFLDGTAPMPADGNMEVNTYGVRLFRSWKQGQGARETGRNIELLEDDVEVLQHAFRDVLTTMGHDFFNVQGVAVNYELQYVEAALVAFGRNQGARGG